MTKTSKFKRDATRPGTSGKAGLKAWITPRIDRISAGQAEVGTRASNDGAFTTS